MADQSMQELIYGAILAMENLRPEVSRVRSEPIFKVLTKFGPILLGELR